MVPQDVLAPLLDTAIKGAVVLGVASVLTLTLRRRSAAERHLLWLLALGSVLALPLFSALLPGWRILPRWRTSVETPEFASAPLPQPIADPSPPQPIAVPEIYGHEPALPAAAVAAADLAPGVAAAPAWWTGLGWEHAVVAAWLAGLVTLLLRYVLGVVFVWRIGRQATPVTDAAWLAVLRETARCLAVRRRVALLESSRCTIPMTWGLRRPMVLLPTASRAWPGERRQAVLAHELAHVKRGDCLAQLVAQAARAVYWFNPLVWLAWRRLLAESERACDDLVLLQGSKASDYAEQLLRVAAGAKGEGLLSSAAIAMARPSQLEGRLLAILDETRNRRRLTRAVVAVALLLMTAAVVPLSIIKAVEEDQSGRVLAAESSAGPWPAEAVAQKAAEKMLRGRVLDEAGKPLVGADVWLSAERKSRGMPEPRIAHGKSGSEGRFTIVVPPAWVAETMRYWSTPLWAYAIGHQLGVSSGFGFSFPGGASELVMRLKPAAKTSVVVLAPDGRPRAGAVVEPYNVMAQTRLHALFLSLPDELMQLFAASTDSDGRAKLPAVALDQLERVCVTTKDLGRQSQTLPCDEPSMAIEPVIRLQPVGKIEGRLVADRPEMVRGVPIKFFTQVLIPASGDSSSARLTPMEGIADATCDAQGRFVVPVISAGALKMVVGLDEELPLRPRIPANARVRGGETTDLQMPLLPTVLVRGSLRAKDTGKPVPDARIYVHYGVWPQGAGVETGRDGRFSVRALPGPIDAQVGSVPVNYVQLDYPPYEVPEGAKEYDLSPLNVVPAKIVEGRLIDDQDRPVAEASLFIRGGNLGPSYGVRNYGSGDSDSSGRFEMSGVPATIDAAKVTYGVRVLANNLFQWITPESATGNRVVLRLKTTARGKDKASPR
jgi:beta-lactamase regulating signal transducer with metallopeptidase domain